MSSEFLSRPGDLLEYVVQNMQYGNHYYQYGDLALAIGESEQEFAAVAPSGGVLKLDYLNADDSTHGVHHVLFVRR